jgi:hypothetical protein
MITARLLRAWGVSPDARAARSRTPLSRSACRRLSCASSAESVSRSIRYDAGKPKNSAIALRCVTVGFVLTPFLSCHRYAGLIGTPVLLVIAAAAAALDSGGVPAFRITSKSLFRRAASSPRSDSLACTSSTPNTLPFHANASTVHPCYSPAVRYSGPNRQPPRSHHRNHKTALTRVLANHRLTLISYDSTER